MGGFEHNTQFALQKKKRLEQTDGIAAPGKGDQHSVSRRKKPVVPYKILNSMLEFFNHAKFVHLADFGRLPRSHRDGVR
jgi:hypothetical protein